MNSKPEARPARDVPEARKIGPSLAIPLVASVLLHTGAYCGYQTFKQSSWSPSQRILAKLSAEPQRLPPTLIRLLDSQFTLAEPLAKTAVPLVLVVTVDPGNTPEPIQEIPPAPTAQATLQAKAAEAQAPPESPKPQPENKLPEKTAVEVVPPPRPKQEVGTLTLLPATDTKSAEMAPAAPAPENTTGTAPAGRPSAEHPAGLATPSGSGQAPAATGTGGAPPNSGTAFLSANLKRPPDLSRHYPYGALAKGITGATRILLQVNQRGQVTEAKIAASEPPGIFNSAALRVARGLQFHPATEHGRPVASEFDLTIEWKLKP